MAKTETPRLVARRKPKAIEFSILFGWHALFSGAFVVAYLSGDEDTYAMHQFAGYLLLAALVIRLIAAMVAPLGSPLRLRRPDLASLKGWATTALENVRTMSDRLPALPRAPVFAAMAALLLAVIGSTAVSGAVADFIPPMEGLHEALGEFALWIVLGHVAIVLAIHVLPRLRHSPAGRPMPVGGREQG